MEISFRFGQKDIQNKFTEHFFGEIESLTSRMKLCAEPEKKSCIRPNIQYLLMPFDECLVALVLANHFVAFKCCRTYSICFLLTQMLSSGFAYTIRTDDIVMSSVVIPKSNCQILRKSSLRILKHFIERWKGINSDKSNGAVNGNQPTIPFNFYGNVLAYFVRRRVHMQNAKYRKSVSVC